MSGRKGDSSVPQKKKLSHGWIEVMSKTYPDRIYFYNTTTKCSTWINPCENISETECNDSSSEASSPHRIKSPLSHLKMQKNKFHSPERNRNSYNNEIEDYDEEQDQYFENVHTNPLGLRHSKFTSPSRSPDSISSENDSESPDSDRHSSNILLENSKKKLRMHFVSSPEKLTARKSASLCDFDKPTTSKSFGTEKSNEKDRKKARGSSTESSRDFCNSDDFNCIANQGTNGFIKKKNKKTNRKNSFSEKAVKSLSLKRTDKTPAQTRLLKFRKQHAEKLKELASTCPDFVIPKKKEVDNNLNKSKDSGTSDLHCLARNESDLKRFDSFGNNQHNENHSEVTVIDVEEMDWEPSNVESDVKNINAMRQQLSKTTGISNEVFFGLNNDHSVSLPCKNSLILVLDTNIFVSCLDFVKEIRDTKIPDLGYPVIYVPWRALQELDHLKDTKIHTVDGHIHRNVRRAIAYLNDSFKSRHPRVLGQPFEDFAKMVDVEAFSPDDEILQTCIQLQKENRESKLMLLTNDKNLESKAVISGVDAYSKDRFMKKYLNSCSGYSPTGSAPNISSSGGVRLDDIICEVKLTLKEFITVFVETEMKIAFEGDWIKMAAKKPPWTFQDAMECLLKHWRSVFFLIFSKETRCEAERLYERLFKVEPGSMEDTVEVIKTIQRLLISIKRDQKKKRPYLDLIPAMVTRLSNLLRTISPNYSPQDESGTSAPSIGSASQRSESSQTPPVPPPSGEDVSKVRALFKDLWDSLRSFCCSLSDIIQSSDANNYVVVQGIRLKVLEILNQVRELVTTVEKIFQINVCDINERHPLISHFSNFLSRVYPDMASDLKAELPRCLAAFFTDFEARSLLSSSLNDFREFTQDLLRAVEYFDIHPEIIQ